MKFKLPISVFIMALGLSLTVLAQSKNTSGASTLPKPRPVESTQEWKPHVGLLGGISTPDGSGNSSGAFGIDVGYQYYIPFSLGAEYIHSDVDNGATTDSRDSLMVKGSYNFGGENAFLSKTYAAVALGVVFTPDGTAVAAAPILGFDYPLKDGEKSKDYFSVGASTRYTFVGNNETDTFSLLGAVKYWY
ncbi:hypothetical protein [Pseudobdellovibrio exovorus]|uniref:Outer membrane protein beta-barrel domain-containing protein n=1 Tax=Pseudobdellovibrio exovorus JSS TaxID=1184267 RepID=M4V990_9BACT|nr:hypothetical protein [Pseudobdellovibrio exovorus]AGH94586.1 hypothetical protein A11Q_366 [Pseudobdellovibrio exovorus JSS]